MSQKQHLARIAADVEALAELLPENAPPAGQVSVAVNRFTVRFAGNRERALAVAAKLRKAKALRKPTAPPAREFMRRGGPYDGAVIWLRPNGLGTATMVFTAGMRGKYAGDGRSALRWVEVPV